MAEASGLLAALGHDQVILRKLVGREVSEDFLDSRSLRHLLAAVGDDRGLEELILAAGSTEVRDDQGLTPLHVAAYLGNEKAVHTLLRHGADVHAKEFQYSHTPLHSLAVHGKGSSASSVSILKALLQHAGQAGLDLLTARDIEGATPLHLAAKSGDAHLLKELLEAYHTMSCAGSSSDAARLQPSATTSFIDSTTNKGATPLHFAAANGNLDAVCLLLEASANKGIRDANGATPFHLAASCGNTSVLERVQLDNVNDRMNGTYEFTALHLAVGTSCIEGIRWLLEHGALVDAMIEDGVTSLHLAAMNGSSQVLEILILEGGANPQQLSHNGTLALGLADEFQHHDAAKVLVNAIKQSGQEKIKESLWAVHNSTGASLLHYFAAYGTEDQLKWILALIAQSKTSYHMVHDEDPVNKRDKRGRTAVHWAAMRSNKDAVNVLAVNKADLNAESREKRYKTPMALAFVEGEFEFAEELLKWKPKLSKAEDWLKDIRTWMYEYYLDDDKHLGKELASLKQEFIKHTNGTIDEDMKSLFSEIPPLYLALHAKRDDIAKFIQRHSKGEEDAVNEKGEHTGYSALHWATLLRQKKIVAQLCRVEVFARELTANAEDKYGKTALQYAKEMKLEEIEKELIQRSDVQSNMDAMYKDRQVLVDAGNAILVGAALIAGVTFAGWLQPPLSYTLYYNLPQLPPPSPQDSFQAYAAVQQHTGVRFFWVFNSLSFSFAIATMIAGLIAVVPIPGTYIATSVAHLRCCLPIASAFLGLSIVFVLAAFAAAGFAVLPPIFEYQANMMATVIVGGIPCLILLAWFACRLWSLRPGWVKAIGTAVLSKLHPQKGGRTPLENSPNELQGSTPALSNEGDPQGNDITLAELQRLVSLLDLEIE